jgi:hypothetical protein
MVFKFAVVELVIMFFDKVEKLEEVKKKTVKAEIVEDSTQTENCEKEVIEKKLGKTAKKYTLYMIFIEMFLLNILKLSFNFVLPS